MEYIPYARQYIDDEDIQSVVDVLKSDWLTTGPAIPEFEKKFAGYVGARYAVSIANGTAALHAACFAAGIKPGDEVIVPAITFAATSNAALYCGAKPVFADINPDTYNIDIVDVKKKITKQTKAIIPVHYAGLPCDMAPILKLAQEHQLIVIEDAAHALGATYQGKKVGAICPLTTFSFHPVKHIATGEGGMITTDDKNLYEKLLLFRNHGITRDASNFLNAGEGYPDEACAWYYEQQLLGYNYRLSDIQAALGLSQLKKIESFIKRRREIVQLYRLGFEGTQGIQLPTKGADNHSAWHLFVIQVAKRDAVFQKLREWGIGVNVHYIPVYRHPWYRQNGYRDVFLSNSEAFYAHCISLPLYYSLTQEQVAHIIELVKKAIIEVPV